MKRGFMENLEQDKQPTSATKKQPKESPLAMPIDQEESLFSVNRESSQYKKILEQLRAEFLQATSSTSQK